MTSLVYRDARPSDAGSLSVLFARSFTETFGHLYDARDLAAFLDRLTEAAWEKELRDSSLAVRLVEADGQAIALAKVGPVSLPVEPPRPSAELRQLYILKDWHGAGVAQVLMTWVLQQARVREAEEMYLSVYIDNHRARRFYERYGFEFVKPYVFMVGNHADEDHIMRLRLAT